MKVKTFVSAVMVVALGLVLSHCASQRAINREAAPPAQQVRVEYPPPPEEEAVVAQKPIPAPVPFPIAAAAGLSDIHFDYNKSHITAGEADVLKKNYSWFAANQGRVRIEGYCDERGTVEYNLVLGQSRADSAKAYMLRLGVDAKRVETISYGKENPVDQGHTEVAWSKNRRVHFAPMD